MLSSSSFCSMTIIDFPRTWVPIRSSFENSPFKNSIVITKVRSSSSSQQSSPMKFSKWRFANVWLKPKLWPHISGYTHTLQSDAKLCSSWCYSQLFKCLHWCIFVFTRLVNFMRFYFQTFVTEICLKQWHEFMSNYSCLLCYPCNLLDFPSFSSSFRRHRCRLIHRCHLQFQRFHPYSKDRCFHPKRLKYNKI